MSKPKFSQPNLPIVHELDAQMNLLKMQQLKQKQSRYQKFIMFALIIIGLLAAWSWAEKHASEFTKVEVIKND